MALPYISRAWALARNVEDLLGLQKEVRQSLQVIEQRLRALEDRMLKLETEQGRVSQGAQRSDRHGEWHHFLGGDTDHAP